ncbi:MAG: aldo/keto reductase [Anaerolineae bacterium]
MNSIGDTVTLRNSVEMPWLGLGTFELLGETAERAVSWALDIGYRSIDTAAVYHNEAEVGRAILASAVPRREVFLTTKVWNTDQGYDSTLAAFDASLERLGTDYVDLYLVHWPVEGKFRETWRALEDLYDAGRTRAIGVSNFLVHHLEDLLEEAWVTPMVNQVEFHPRLQQPKLRAFCTEHAIRLQAWRPIMQGDVLEIPELISLARERGKSPIQITLRWMIQKGVVAIPRSSKRSHIEQNAAIFDFEIGPDEMALIDEADLGLRTGEDPDSFDFGS